MIQEQTNRVLLWLDDVRPAPSGWLWVTNVIDAKSLLESGRVAVASLDHDLGACAACMNGRTAEQWLDETRYTNAPHCSHVGTGYDLCLWMAETGHWPQDEPSVHSANPVGAERMRGVIRRYFKTRSGDALTTCRVCGGHTFAPLNVPHIPAGAEVCVVCREVRLPERV